MVCRLWRLAIDAIFMKDQIQFDTLAAWRELWLYMNVLMNGTKLPTYIKYSIGEDILKDMLKIGQKLDLSNKIRNTRPSRAKQLAFDASDIYDQVKFALDQLIDSGYIKDNPDGALPDNSRGKASQPLKPQENRQRERLSYLRADFGGKLGGWLKSFHPAG